MYPEPEESEANDGNGSFVLEADQAAVSLNMRLAALFLPRLIDSHAAGPCVHGHSYGTGSFNALLIEKRSFNGTKLYASPA
jgi:hypothetical protein